MTRLKCELELSQSTLHSKDRNASMMDHMKEQHKKDIKYIQDKNALENPKIFPLGFERTFFLSLQNFEF